jgi:hypothetical protein
MLHDAVEVIAHGGAKDLPCSRRAERRFDTAQTA